MIRSKVTNLDLEVGHNVLPKPAARLSACREGTTLASFERLADLGAVFIERVVDAIETDTETLSLHTARTRARTAKAFLHYLASDSSSEAKQIRAETQAGDAIVIEPETAHQVELRYRKKIAARYRAGSASLAGVICNTNVVIRLFASRGLWPQTLRLPPELVARDRLRPRPSLLEALGRAGVPTTDKNRTNSSLESAIGGLRRLNIAVPQPRDELSSALLEGERRCLDELSTAARRIFDDCYAAWSTMQPLIENAENDDEAQLRDWLASAIETVAQGARNQSFEARTSEFFPSTLQGLARFLALLDLYYMRGADSKIHSVEDAQQPSMSIRLRTVAYRVRSALTELNLRLPHDLDKVRGLLTSSRDAVGSAAVLLMTETGMNTSPLLNLPWDHVKKTDDSHWISIASWKQRAGGSLIEEELRLSEPGDPTSAGRALERLREMSARHAKFDLGSSAMKALAFSYAAGHAGESVEPLMKRLTNNIFAECFGSIAKSALGQRSHVCPSSIRPSLLMTTRGHTASVRTAQLAAGHKSADTTLRSYAGSHRALHHIDHIRSIREFQERLQQIAVHNRNDPGLLNEIHTDPDRVEDAIRTGLGALCLRLAESRSGDSPDCLSLESCPGCSRIQISTRPEDLADLLAFGEHLARHETWLQTYRPKAWLTRWLPWSLLIEEVLRRGSRSTWARQLMRAREINANRTTPSFPPLW